MAAGELDRVRHRAASHPWSAAAMYQFWNDVVATVIEAAGAWRIAEVVADTTRERHPLTFNQGGFLERIA